MNEAETRAEHIDPALAACGWGVVEGSRIRREYAITPGRLEGLGRRGKGLTADYVLIYRNTKLAIVEAKAWDVPITEGVGQAKNYAKKLEIRYAYATNGQGIYAIDMKTGTECDMPQYPTPDQLWGMTFAEANAWCDRFTAIPFEDKGGSHPSRYYQDIAVERVLEAIAGHKQRILLTLATGTGKTFIAFQIVWKLFHSRWNLSREPSRRPRILFLADRNILANQAYNAFSAFSEDALVRIDPESIRKKGKVPKNGSIFFTIFQTFMASASSATGLSAVSEYSVSELVELPEIAEPNEGAGGYRRNSTPVFPQFRYLSGLDRNLIQDSSKTDRNIGEVRSLRTAEKGPGSRLLLFQFPKQSTRCEIPMLCFLGMAQCIPHGRLPPRSGALHSCDKEKSYSRASYQWLSDRRDRKTKVLPFPHGLHVAFRRIGSRSGRFASRFRVHSSCICCDHFARYIPAVAILRSKSRSGAG